MASWWPLSRVALQGQRRRGIIGDVNKMLYIPYFPVYGSTQDYNNFTSARSWALLILTVEWINVPVALVSQQHDSSTGKTGNTRVGRVQAVNSLGWAPFWCYREEPPDYQV